MKVFPSSIASLAGLVIASTLVAAQAEAPKAKVIAEWNRLPFHLSDAAAEKAYWENKLYEKVLLQGVKSDSVGNLYVSTARWGGADVPATVSKLASDGKGSWVLVPYPSEAMNKVGDPKAFQSVLGFEIDRNDVFWILDQGHIAGKPSEPGAEKLVLWDINKNQEIQRYVFSDADSDRKCSFLNDVVVDNDSGFGYITDSGIFCDPLHGGLIIYDSKKNVARRIFDQSSLTNDEPGFKFKIHDRSVLEKTPMRIGADGIALSGDKKTLYWSNLTGHALYSIPTAVLRDFSKSEAELKTAVTKVAELPSNTDGMTADRDNNLYMTALELNGLMHRNAETGKVTKYWSDASVSWADTLGWGPDGSLYLVTNHLHLWLDKAMNFDNPMVTNFRIWNIAVHGTPYLKQ